MTSSLKFHRVIVIKCQIQLVSISICSNMSKEREQWQIVVFYYKTVSLSPLTDKNDLIWSCARHDWGRNPMDPSSSFWTSKVDLPMRRNNLTWSPRITANVFVPFVADEFWYSCQTRYVRFRCLWIGEDNDETDDE